MSRWITKFLETRPPIRTDNTDRFGKKVNMSVLSVPSRDPSRENEKKSPPLLTDNTDRFETKVNMSVLSVPSRGLPGENEKNTLFLLTDNTDRFGEKANVSVLSVPSLEENLLLEEFEERLAIAEYDGHQPPAHAQRVAYQDAFIAVLADLPYEENDEKDWLQERIKAAQERLLKQGLGQPS